MFGFKKETVLWEKVGNFRKSCLTNFDKIQNFVTLKMGYQSLRGHPAIFLDIFVSFFTVLGK